MSSRDQSHLQVLLPHREENTSLDLTTKQTPCPQQRTPDPDHSLAHSHKQPNTTEPKASSPALLPGTQYLKSAAHSCASSLLPATITCMLKEGLKRKTEKQAWSSANLNKPEQMPAWAAPSSFPHSSPLPKQTESLHSASEW